MVNFFKNKTYSALAVFGLIILSLILFFIFPLLLELKNSSGKLLSEKNDAAMLIAQSNEIESFKKAYGGYKPNLEKMEKMFIDPKNPVEFIKFLENAALASGIKSKISLVSNQENPDTASFQLFSSDDFSKILRFSEKLENGPYLIQIQNVSIKSAGIDIFPSGKVDISFLINAFTK